jgi:hypothetical protein
MLAAWPLNCPFFAVAECQQRVLEVECISFFSAMHSTILSRSHQCLFMSFFSNLRHTH